MASIKDIAKMAGCTISTVSRVLNDRDAVAPETRKKVLAAINQLDYKPSLTARGLRVKQVRLIGLAVPAASAGAFNMIIQNALDCAYKYGYNLMLVNTHEDPELEEKFIGDLLRRNTTGIILSRVSDDSRILKKIVKQKIPIVVIDRALENENVSNVVLNNHRAGYLAGKHLLEFGHKRLACITGQMKIALCRERLAGFREALREADVELTDSKMFEGDFKFESGIAGIRKLCTHGCDFTAIWAMNDWMAFGALQELQRVGVKVPEDVSVVGMDDSETAAVVSPSLTTIHYPFNELVERAFDLLLAQIDSGVMSAKTAVIEPKITIRQSSAQCSKESA